VGSVVSVLHMATIELRIAFDAQLMAEDMVRKGWHKLDLAKRARVADMTVIRFLRGERQTAKTAKKLARALGHEVDRYLITSQQTAPAMEA
jgi:transcriptional regulator with XRE-family HTH domain